MKPFAFTLLAAVFTLSTLGGCLVRTTPRHHHHHGHGHGQARARPACEPSHYWDGHKCRHKGKGRGARKHDHR